MVVTGDWRPEAGRWAMDVVVRPLDGAAGYLLAHPVLVAAVAATAVWGLALLATAFATRARPARGAPATMDLGSEPPAVANLLVNAWGLTQEAVQGTLIDLAARKHLELDQVGDGPERTLIRVRHGRGGEDGEPLTDYERMVLERVAGLAVDGVVPAQALPMGTQATAQRWWRRFNQLVVADAQRRGLSRARIGGGLTTAFGIAAAVPAVLLGIHLLPLDLGDDNGPGSGAIPGAIALFIVLSALIRTTVRGQRDTQLGRERAAHWLGVRDYLARDEVFPSLPPAAVTMWDRYLAYGAALGVAGTALRALPVRAASDTKAWSGYGGRWREVAIAYRSYNPTHPLVRLLVAVFYAALIGGAASVLGRLDVLPPATDRLVDVGVVLFGVLVAVLVALRLVRFFSTPSSVEVEGQVLRLRERGGGEDSPPTSYAAVDDGTADKVEAWPLTSAALYHSMREGAIVRITTRPRRGHVDAVAVVKASTWADLGDVGPDGDSPPPASIAEHLVGALQAAGPLASPTDLVTAADASTALGEPVAPADDAAAEQLLPVAHHIWRSSASKRRYVMLQLVAGGMARMALRMNRRRGTPLPAAGGAELFKLRDAVVLFSGDQALTIRVHSDRVGDEGAAAEALARVAAERLGAGEAPAPPPGPELLQQ
jgi:hypothetical protein